MIADTMTLWQVEVSNEQKFANTKEKARIIEKMIAAKNAGEKIQTPHSKKPKLYHCDTVGE